MSPSRVLVVVLAVAAVGTVILYQAVAREGDYRALLARGDAALRDEQIFGAIEAYSGAIALRPDSILAHLRRGETYRRRGDLDTAARDFQVAAELDSTATRPLDELGDVRYQQQRFLRAAELYERCLRLDDRAPRVAYKLALALYRSGNPEGALAALATTLRLDDRMAEGYYLQGLCFRDQRKPAQALQAFQKALTVAPNLIPAREEVADLYRSQGRRGDELEQLQLLAGLDRNHVERQVGVGLAHARWAADEQEPLANRSRHADLAVLTLTSVMERTPDQPRVYTALGRVWLEIAQARDDTTSLGKATEALAQVDTSTASSETLTLYGRALLQSGRADLAEDVLLRATQRYPIEPTAFLLHATAAEQQHHLQAARQALLDYGALVADDAEAGRRAARIGTLSLRLNDLAGAIEWLERGLARDPDDLHVLVPLAEAQYKTGDRRSAAATLARGLTLDPDNPALLALSRRIR